MRIFILPSYKKDTIYMKYKYDYWDSVLELENVEVININPSTISNSNALYLKRQVMTLYEYEVMGKLQPTDYIIVEDRENFNDFSVKAKYITFVDDSMQKWMQQKKLRKNYSGVIYTKWLDGSERPNVVNSKLPIIRFPKLNIPRKDQILFIDDSQDKKQQYFFVEQFKLDFPQYEFLDLSTIPNVSSFDLFRYMSESKIVFCASLDMEINPELYTMALQAGCVPFVPNKGMFTRLAGRYRYSVLFTDFEKIQKSKKWKRPAMMFKLSDKIKFHIKGIMEDYWIYELQTYQDFENSYKTYYSDQNKFINKLCQI